MKKWIKLLLASGLLLLVQACGTTETKQDEVTTDSMSAEQILGNPDYLAISYGGYRENSRDIQPTVAQIKEDMLLLHAMGIRMLRTYNTKLKHASTVLEAIRELKDADPNFEMYVMLGAWINCKKAFTNHPNHNLEDAEENAAEIQRAVDMAKAHPDIVKVIAVGNEAMVKWAASYFVQPGVILKWVNYLQDLKAKGELPGDLWITSSDNFASWGGGGEEYHVPDLDTLIKAVDYISMHTYPMHDTHYNPAFWGVLESETDLSKGEQIEQAMLRARDYAKEQYNSVVAYVEGLGVDKPVHIGETGWASFSNGFYGDEGSRACNQYTEGRYYNLIREWTDSEGIACFYFEAFDEPWKDAGNPGGSENYFGLFAVDGEAKYAIWDLVDQGVFEGLSRAGNSITKSYDGDLGALLNDAKIPPVKVIETLMEE